MSSFAVGRSFVKATGGRPSNSSPANFTFESELHTVSSSALGAPAFVQRQGACRLGPERHRERAVHKLETSLYTQLEKKADDAQAVLLLQRLIERAILAVHVYDVHLCGESATVKRVLRAPAVARPPVQVELNEIVFIFERPTRKL